MRELSDTSEKKKTNRKQLLTIISLALLLMIFGAIIPEKAAATTKLQTPEITSITATTMPMVNIIWKKSDYPTGTKLSILDSTNRKTYNTDINAWPPTFNITNVTGGQTVSIVVRALSPDLSQYSDSDYSSTYTVYVPRGYEIKFNANGGTGLPYEGTVKTENEDLTLPTTILTRDGYTFEGWATNSSATIPEYLAGGAYTKDEAVTLYAVWKRITYKITYNANGGSGAPSAQTKIYGETLKLSSSKPTRTGYEFKGWATSASATSAQYQAGGSYTNNAAVTLYAVWEQIPAQTYTIRYDANGGSGAPAAQTKTEGVSLTLSSIIPTRSGYSFLGWATSASATSARYQAGGSYTNDAAVTLYAVWEQIPAQTYTIRYDANGGSGAPATQIKTKGAGLTLSNEKPRKAFSVVFDTNEGTVSEVMKDVTCTFKKWNTKADGSGVSYDAGALYSADADVVLYAQWVNPTIGNIPQPTRTGYIFDGWYTSLSGGEKVTDNWVVTANTTIHARWSKKPDTRYLKSTQKYSFDNSYATFGYKNYYMTNSDFQKLTNYTKSIYQYDYEKARNVINELQFERDSKWGGSCYGMAVTALLDLENRIGLNEHFNSNSMYEVPSPAVNSSVKSAINYYQLSQFIPAVERKNRKSYSQENSNWSAGLKKLVEDADAGNPILFTYGWPDYSSGEEEWIGHAMVINGYQESSDGSHVIYMYDNRYPTQDVTATIDSKYKSCIVTHTNRTGKVQEEAKYVTFTKDLSAFDTINIFGSSNYKGSNHMSAENGDTANLVVDLSGKCTVENAEGQQLIIDGNEYSGSMEVTDTSLIVNGTEEDEGNAKISLEVKDSDAYTFESDTDEISVSVQDNTIFGAAETKGADSVVISKKDGIYVIGDRFSYDLSLSVNNNMCDMVSIAGEADNDVNLIKKGEKIKANGVDTDSGTVKVYSDIVDVDTYSYEKGYDSFEISSAGDGTAGDITIMGSSDGSTNYDTQIGGTSMAETKKSIESCHVEINGESMRDGIVYCYYTGYERRPSVTVTNKEGKELYPEYDYKVRFSENIMPGAATVTIIGTGEYTGVKTETFYIERLHIGKGKILSAKVGKKKVRIKMGYATDADRYQIAYKIKGGKYKYVSTVNQTKTIKKLKSKKIYYIKVRGLYTIPFDNYRIYGKWSKVKKVKIK